MLRNVFLKTLRDLRGQILVWGLGIAIPSATAVIFFPSLQGAPELENFIRILPEPIQRMIGDPASMGTLRGFLKIKLFDSSLPLVLSVFAIVQGAGAIAGERERGTMDLLLAQPVTRRRVVLEKFAAIAVAMTGIAAWIGAGLLAGAALAGVPAERGWLLLATIGLVPCGLVFGGVALVGSCVFRRQRHAMMLAGLVLLWSLFLDTLAPAVEALRPWRVLSVVHYYSGSLPLGEPVHPAGFAVLLALTAALTAAAVWAFQRQELTV